ncbi:MAG: Bifunctional protein FolD [Ignavibacteria bacterium]|nr:Bifunctional protein FolD [Ignavibacteria bacterium]
MPIIIDGKSISAQILSELKVKGSQLEAQHGVRPGLAVLLVGDNPASETYVRNKIKACEEVGFHSVVERLSDFVGEENVLERIHNWNESKEIHGILVQLPLPKQIDEQKILLAISPCKDVDGFHPENIGRLLLGMPGFLPCTPAGIMEILKRTKIQVSGKHVVIVGRSNIVGKPLANLLYQKTEEANAVVTICHTGATNLKHYTQQADVLIVAVGAPHLILADDVKPGSVVIDVGTNRVPDPTSKTGFKLVGDVDFEGVKNKTYAITPVPGGVGPMTIAMLMQNTYLSAEGKVFNKY